MCCQNCIEAEVPIGEVAEAVQVQLGEAEGVQGLEEVPQGEAEGVRVEAQVPLGEAVRGGVLQGEEFADLLAK